jgi:hypothetical protein
MYSGKIAVPPVEVGYENIISGDNICNVWKRNGATEKSAIKDGSSGWGRLLVTYSESPKIYIALH